ncbi:MAG TPA: PKD domain-containing protein [Verrucomicrobiota bacterium]|nr:PKD domain-containing protein [Verrucomicrobiota bacterium]
MKSAPLAILGTLLVILTVSGQSIETQTNRLDSGWNLIAFQVVPSDPAPASVFASLGSDFVAAWSYDAGNQKWTFYGNEAAPANDVERLGNIESGRAYWIYKNGPPTNWVVIGTIPSQTPGVLLNPGWNLVGVPTGRAALSETINMLSVFAASGLDYDMILKWEQGLYRKFTPADTDVDDFTLFDANKGHWVRVKSAGSFNLQPKLLSSVRADVDVEPQGNYPSFEDLQLSTSVTPLDPGHQTNIVFLPGEDSQQLAIANTGGGILAWDVVWTPHDATNVHWLQISSPSGITTIENDAVQLFLDRTHLPKGIYRGTLLLQTTATNRSFEIVANVTDLRGEWRGVARISNVNGKKNEVADIDLHLDFFEDPTVPGLIRGLLDSRNSLLWPVDVPLIGHSGSLSENRFVLGGAFILPPGDQNNRPYATFGTEDDLEDIDWNCNGVVDDVNPFPFPIYRSVLLQGVLESSSAAEGLLITGSYVESVYGMLRRPIRLEGTFSLRRENPIPFANRRPLANQENTNSTQPVILRTFTPPSPLIIPVGRTTNALSFLTDLALQQISLDLDFADAPATGVRFILESPGGQQVTLHDRANLGTLRGLNFPGLRKPVQSFDTLVNSGVVTKGNWKLIIENTSGIAGRLYNWSLQLQGQPVFSVVGRLMSNLGMEGLPGQVFLDGLPITTAVLANSDGTFRFDRLPGIPANFTASLLGYEPLDANLPGLAATYTIPSYGTNCDTPARQAMVAKFRPLPAMPLPPSATDGFGDYGSPGNPVDLRLQPRANTDAGLALLASPPSGFGPLTVQLTLIGGTNSIPESADISWDFGDGSATVSGRSRAVSHTYFNVSPAGYLVTAQVLGKEATSHVVVMPSSGNSPNSLNFFQIHFTSGGTIPADLVFSITGSNDPSQPPAFADLVMVQHADCASFDIDRAPYTTSANRNFHQDGFTNGAPSFNSADYANGFKGEDYNYQVTLAQWDHAEECGYLFDNESFEPHPTLGLTNDCTLPRYRMVCNIGPQILPPANSEVLAIPKTGPSPTFVPASPDPLLASDKNQIAHARDVRLITGPLAVDWNR